MRTSSYQLDQMQYRWISQPRWKRNLGLHLPIEREEVINIASEMGRNLTPLMSEARAVDLALKEATKLGIDFILLESDSLIVINKASGVGSCPWEIDMMILEICAMATRFRGAHIRHICREANGTTDKIVKLRHQLSTEDIQQHHEFQALVHSDAIGYGLTCG